MTNNTREPSLYDIFNDDEQKTPATAQKYLAGLKLTSSHVQKIQLGNQQIDVPTYLYVKLLEDQLRDVRQQVKQQQQTIQRLIRAVNKNASDQDRIRGELAKKMDMGEY